MEPDVKKPNGIGCGSVGRVVASDTRGPQFECRERQISIEHLFSVNYVEKMKENKGKE